MTIATYGLVDDEDIELDAAALVLSELDHPGADLAPYIDLLREIDGRLRELGPEAVTSKDQAQLLATILHGEFSFTGDTETYDAPLNGDFIRVMDRRRGLPVSLSILYVAAARRMGWKADPLNTPGHVLVRIGDQALVVIDPFNGGAIVEERQLLALLKGFVVADNQVSTDRIETMTNRSTLVRLLMNQASRAEHSNDIGRAITLYQRMTLVAPDNPDGWWALARLQLVVGLIEQARSSLSAMLEVTRNQERREIVTTALEAISRANEPSRQNGANDERQR
jgi:regulator of sirC expression with transglutaminase-like and TPR domain